MQSQKEFWFKRDGFILKSLNRIMEFNNTADISYIPMAILFLRWYVFRIHAYFIVRLTKIQFKWDFFFFQIFCRQQPTHRIHIFVTVRAGFFYWTHLHCESTRYWHWIFQNIYTPHSLCNRNFVCGFLLLNMKIFLLLKTAVLSLLSSNYCLWWTRIRSNESNWTTKNVDSIF